MNVPFIDLKAQLPKIRSEIEERFSIIIHKLKMFLKENEIATGLHYPIPLHLTQAYAFLGYKKGDFPVAEKLANEILPLPMYPELTEEQIEYVCEKIKAFYKS